MSCHKLYYVILCQKGPKYHQTVLDHTLVPFLQLSQTKNHNKILTIDMLNRGKAGNVRHQLLPRKIRVVL